MQLALLDFTLHGWWIPFPLLPLEVPVRTLIALVLLVLLSGCAPLLREARQPSGQRSPLGVLIPSIQGRCGTVLVGSNTARLCAPPPLEGDSLEAAQGSA